MEIDLFSTPGFRPISASNLRIGCFRGARRSVGIYENCEEQTDRGRGYNEIRARKTIRARHSIMEIAAKLFPGTHSAVDRLRAEVAARRYSEHQRNV